MPNIPALTQFNANTKAKAAEVNNNFSTIRTQVNAYGLFTDVNATITAIYTFNTAPVFSVAPTFNSGVTLGGQLVVSSGGAAITGNTSVTGTLATSSTATIGGALTVSSGGASITGLTTISGGLSTSGTITAGNGLSVSTGGASVTGNSTVTGNLTVTGTVTAAGLSGPTVVTAANVSPGTFQNGAYAFQAGLAVTGTLSATTFSGSGALLSSVPISAVTNLQSSLDGKAASSHTHPASQVTTGTFSAGNYTFPNNLTVSGTMSPATLSGSIACSGATFASPTLSNATFTGTTSGLNLNPTSLVYGIGGATTIGTTLTSLLSATPGSGTWLAIATFGVTITIPAGQLAGRVRCDLGTSTVWIGHTLGATAGNDTTVYLSATLVTTTTGTITLQASRLSTCTATANVEGTNLAVIRIA